MFNHATQLFSRKPSLKKPLSRKAMHLRDISTTSINSNSSSSSTASSASTPTLSATSSSFSSPTTSRQGPFAPPAPANLINDPSIPDLNPLSQNPTYGPPPPLLSERPLIQPTHPVQEAPVQPAPLAVVAPKPIAPRIEWRAHLVDMIEMSVPQFPQDYSPRHTIHTSTPVSNSASTSAQDYFVLKVPTRPELKSHWSASTIQTPDVDDCRTPMSPYDEDDEEREDEEQEREVGEHQDEAYAQDSRGPTPSLTPSLTPSPPISGIIESYCERDSVASVATVTEAAEHARQFPPPQKAATEPVRNFSYKRCTVTAPLSSSSPSYGERLKPSSDSPRRPQMKTVDSIECWIKRGGWKRRGIVFQQGEGEAALVVDD